MTLETKWKSAVWLLSILVAGCDLQVPRTPPAAEDAAAKNGATVSPASGNASAGAGAGATEPEPAPEPEPAQESVPSDGEETSAAPAVAPEAGFGEAPAPAPVALAGAGAGTMDYLVRFDGRLEVLPDRRTIVVAGVSGVVLGVLRSEGDDVAAGDVLAVVESRELGEAKSAFLSARERLRQADEAYQQEERLRRQNVSAATNYLRAKAALAEADLVFREAARRLRVMGLAGTDLTALGDGEADDLGRHELVSPVAGRVLRCRVLKGQSVTGLTEAFDVADLSLLGASVAVPGGDLDLFSPGTTLSAWPEGAGEAVVLEVVGVGPVIDPATGLGTVRARLSNGDGRWRPGLGVAGRHAFTGLPVLVRVPRKAVVVLDGGPVVFVPSGETFEARPVVLGRRTPDWVEVVDGLAAGADVVASGRELAVGGSE